VGRPFREIYQNAWRDTRLIHVSTALTWTPLPGRMRILRTGVFGWRHERTMIKAGDLRKGRTVTHNNELYIVHEAQHMSKGNWRSYMQVKLKNMKSGQILDVRFRMDDMLATPFLEQKEMEYLYQDGKNLVVMDTESYEQMTLDKEVLGDSIAFLKENERLTCQFHEGKVVTAELPNVVELTVKDTPPVVKGATATNQPKDALLETGARVKVPAFIEIGERVRVDTRTGEYVERAK